MIHSYRSEDRRRQRHSAQIVGTGAAYHPFYELASDETISDDGWQEEALSPKARVWLPSNLDDAKRGELLGKFRRSYLDREATLESVAVRNSPWGLGVIFLPTFRPLESTLESDTSMLRLWVIGVILIPPIILLVIGAGMVWAFSGFRAGSSTKHS